MRALLVIAALVLSGCATRGGVQISPEGTAALRTNQLVQSLRTTVTPVGASPLEQLVASKYITVEEGVKAGEWIQRSFVYAGDLAAVLKIVDDAKDAAERHNGLVKAGVLVQKIADGLREAVLSIGTDEGRRKVSDILDVASSVLLTIGSIFPAPVPAGGL